MTRIAPLLVLLTALDDAAQPRVDRHGDPLPPGALMRLGTVRGRANVTSFGVLADGTVVTVGEKGDVRTWAPDEDTPGPSVTLPRPGQQMYALPQVSPDGTRVAVNGLKAIVVYDRTAAESKKLAEFAVERTVRMVFSPDGTKLFVAATAKQGYDLFICDVRTGKARRIDDMDSQPRCLGWSGDGKRVAGSWGYHFMAWAADTGRPVGDFETDRAKMYIGHFALDHTGDVVAFTDTGREPYTVRFMSALDGKLVAGLTGPETLGWVTFAPDGKSVLAGWRDGVVWWDHIAAKLIRRFDGSSMFTGVWTTPGRLTADGKTVVVCTEQALLRWDAATGKPLFPLQDAGHQDEVYGLRISPDGKTIATSGMDNRTRTWDAATSKPLHVLASDWTRHNLHFSPDGRFLYGPGVLWGGPVKWDLTTGKQVFRAEFDPAEPKQSRPETLRLSPDGRTLTGVSRAITARDPGFVTVWDAETGQRRSTTRRGPMLGLELDTGRGTSPDGRWAAVAPYVFPAGGAFDDNVIPIEVLKRFHGMFPGVFSPDSRLVAVSGTEMEKPGRPTSTAVCELATGGVVLEVPGGIAAFSPDGRIVAVAAEKTIAFWDTGTGRELGRLATEGLVGKRPHVANGMVFFPDGTRLVSSHTDTTALVWPVPARPKAAKPDDAGRDAAWDALAGADAAKAGAAVAALADDAGAATFLKGKLTPVKVPAGKLPPGDAVRAVRAIAALEKNGAADAKALLTEHATGPAETTAAEARRALDRVGK